MSRFEPVAAALAERGWYTGEGLLAPETVRDLAAEARALFGAGRFEAAGTGRARAHAVRPEIRGDSVFWIDEDHESAATLACRDAFDELRLTLNRELYAGLAWFEMHLARYPPGARYGRHLDCFSDESSRAISFILYLNEAWEHDDGGALRLWLDDGPRDILPRAGTWVTFRSEQIEHEVLPARRGRDSLTGWYRRRQASGNR